MTREQLEIFVMKAQAANCLYMDEREGGQLLNFNSIDNNDLQHTFEPNNINLMCACKRGREKI